MSAATTGRPAKVAPLASSAATSAARSSGMCRRSASIGTWAVPSYPSVCRLTTRNRNGAGRGAEARR
ncbi:Uncharacterised protein [Mycobacterium tuberculosis]|nr:Uncharacterised protein [Mycobacterium tuberculosis]